MAVALQYLNWIVANGPSIVAAIVAVLSSLIALFMLIPGEQPEKFLQGAVDFLSKFSVKK